VSRKVHREWRVRSGDDLGRSIAEIRRLRKWTQEELARDAGIERTYLTRMELGRSVQMIDRALRTLNFLGASVTVTWDGDVEE
jgi:transcriptional regulator with XRE-family HTH domain